MMIPARSTASGEGPNVIFAFSILTSITTIAIALRVYVRGWMIKSFGIDDWTAIVGWSAYIGLASFIMAATHHGFGQHAEVVEPHSEIEIGLRLAWISELLYAVSNLAVKLSICFALLRFINEHFQRRLLYVVIASTSLSCIILFIILIVQCRPVSFFWRRSRGDAHGTCIDPDILVIAVYIYSVISVLCDWTMAILPWFLVRKLRMSTRDKVLVTFVLAMGSIASVAALGRLGYVRGFSKTDDLLYELASIAIWSGCETGLGLFASCVATLRPLLRNFCARRRRASLRQVPINLPAVASPRQKTERPRSLWSDLLDTNTGNGVKSSYASTSRTVNDSRSYDLLEV